MKTKMKKSLMFRPLSDKEKIKNLEIQVQQLNDEIQGLKRIHQIRLTDELNTRLKFAEQIALNLSKQNN